MRQLRRQRREVELLHRQQAHRLAAEQGDVELASGDELFDEERLTVLVAQRLHLPHQLVVVVDDRRRGDAERGVLLGELDEQRILQVLHRAQVGGARPRPRRQKRRFRRRQTRRAQELAQLADEVGRRAGAGNPSGQLLAILWFSAMARPVSAEEQPRFGVAPPQPWVEAVSADLKVAAPVDEISSGVHVLLSDTQVRLFPRSFVRYRHLARRALSAEGVSGISQVSISFDPSYQELTIHHVRLGWCAARRAGMRCAASRSS